MVFHDIIIVGGGASGLMAAITCFDLGKKVAILESTNRIGNKILSTGNGRCNISNSNIISPFNNYQSENKNFAHNCLNEFSVKYTKNIFSYLGLPIIEKENNKLFPKSLQASSVVDILKMAIDDRNIPIYTNCKVESIINKDSKFILKTSNADISAFTCNKLALTCGGKSAPKSGSDGSGFKLAEKLGHKLIKPLPGIVQLKLDYPYLKALSGIKVEGKVKIYANNSLKREDSGELLFTDYGISGPPILQLSALASKNLESKQEVILNLDIMPDITQNEVNDFIFNHLEIFSHRSISTALIGILNKKLVPILLKDIGIFNIHMPCCDLDWKYKKLLCERLKKWSFKCIDTNGFNNAQLTVGGIDTTDVNPNTLESNLIKNLYFAGEILDVNGDCGGYNLQWAWSSGILIGHSF